MTTRDNESPLFSVEAHAVLLMTMSRIRRDLQAQHKRILGRSEAELRIRQLQEKLMAAEERLVRPEKSTPPPPISQWPRWFGSSALLDQQRTSSPFGVSSEREVELIKEQLARLIEIDNPILLVQVEATARAIAGEVEEVPKVPNLATAARVIEEDEDTDASPSPSKPGRKQKSTGSSNGAL